MTGGGGALPFFNAFMIPFMKDKPRETFASPPPIPSDIRSLIARNKREELEKLEEAELAGRKTGVDFDAGPKPTPDPAFVTTDTTTDGTPTTTDGGTDTAKPASADPPAQKPPVTAPPRKPDNDPPAERPEGSKRKGKKGDG